MSVEIIMPKAGMAMEEGTIIKWLKEEGEAVKEGEPIVEILTDKVNMEVEAESTGYLLKKVRFENEVLPVFTVIGYIGEKGEDIAAPAEKKGEVKAEEKVSDEKEYDVIVIGGGPAGYISANKVSQLGGKAALIEKRELGGTCLNRGCIPTKTYIKNVEILEEAEKAQSRGLDIKITKNISDLSKAVEFKNKVTKKLSQGVGGLLRSYGVEVYNTTGKLLEDKRVILEDGTVLKGKKIILAGGSKTKYLNIPGIDSKKILTSTSILDLNMVPERLVIVGGGVIGCEFAEIFRGYGTEVTIVEAMSNLLPFNDKEISEELEKIFKRKGIKILTDKQVTGFKDTGNEIETELKTGESLKSEYVLFSVGREADLSCVEGLEIEQERGRLLVNEYMETSIEGVYAAGDINGISMLAHSAFKMGETAAANAMGGREEARVENTPKCVYTLPEIASVGLTEEEALKKYGEIRTGRFNFGANGRAIASSEEDGFVKVICDNKYGEILGIHIIGSKATEMIAAGVILIEMEITIEEASEVIYAHPTFSEAILEACADCLGKALHLPKKKR
jgi:dihydrolipoamide dehydrogenase